MLTGKAIHEIVQTIIPGAQPEQWDEHDEKEKATIEAMAAKITETYITPLQGVKSALDRHLASYQQALEMPDVQKNPRRRESIIANYTALEAVLLDLPDQQTLRTVYTVHNCEAAEGQIGMLELENARLQKLIEKYNNLAEGYQNLTDNADDILDSEWHEEKRALDARAHVLLGEDLVQESDTLTPETEAMVAMAKAMRVQAEKNTALVKVLAECRALIVQMNTQLYEHAADSEEIDEQVKNTMDIIFHTLVPGEESRP